MASSSGGYEQIVKGGLKLKGAGGLTDVGAKKKRKSKHQEELEQLKALAKQQEEEEQHLSKSAKLEKTPAQRAFELAKEKRQGSRVGEAIQYTHRQRMDRFNIHLGSLSEHFDIPKVGPG